MTDLEAVAAVEDGCAMQDGQAIGRHQTYLVPGVRRRFCNHAGSLIAGS